MTRQEFDLGLSNFHPYLVNSYHDDARSGLYVSIGVLPLLFLVLVPAYEARPISQYLKNFTENIFVNNQNPMFTLPPSLAEGNRLRYYFRPLLLLVLPGEIGLIEIHHRNYHLALENY